jgi:hypothetical protein
MSMSTLRLTFQTEKEIPMSTENLPLGTELVCVSGAHLSTPGATMPTCEVRAGMQGIVCGHDEPNIIVSLPLYALSVHVNKGDFEDVWAVVP